MPPRMGTDRPRAHDFGARGHRKKPGWRVVDAPPGRCELDQGAVDAAGAIEPMGAADGNGPTSVPAAVTVNVWTMPSAKCGGAVAQAGSGDAEGSGSAVIPWGTKQSAMYSPSWV